MAGMKGKVSYQLPWLCAVEWAVEVKGEIYRNILEELPCSGLEHCPQGLKERATWRHWRIMWTCTEKKPIFHSSW
jgi:hypothetical protein